MMLTRREWVHCLGALGYGLSAAGSLLGGCRPRRRAGPEDEAEELGPIEKELNLYIWSDYLAPDTIPNFESEFGVRVTVDTYESNEEMAAKLQAGAQGYDLVVPTSYILPVLYAADLLAPLRRKHLPNWGNLAPLFLDPPWDPGNRHTVPWQWGTTGIAYRKDRVAAPPESWGVFLETAHRGKMTMLDDPRDVIGAWLRYRGHSLNSVDRAELEQAKADAVAAKLNLRAFVSATVKGQLVAGDVWIAQLWSGDTAQARAEQPAIEFVLPREGSTIFVDVLALPRTARHPRAAHEFMNYVLRPEVGAALADQTGYGTPNLAALPRTRAKVPYPTPSELARLEYQQDLGRAGELWDRIWTEIKAA